MASLAQQFTGLRFSPFSSSSRLSRRAAKNFPQNKSASVSPTTVAAVAMSSGQNKDRLELKKMFEDAYERCRTAPMEGVAFTVDDFAASIEQYDFNSEKAAAEELLEKEIPLKFVEVDEEQTKLVLSNRKAVADSQAQLGIGSVCPRSCSELKTFGAFIDIGGINGFLHVSQISHNHVSDIATVLQPGDTLKVYHIYSYSVCVDVPKLHICS